MIWLYPKHKPGQAQFCFFYQHLYPALRRGAYLKDLVKEL